MQADKRDIFVVSIPSIGEIDVEVFLFLNNRISSYISTNWVTVKKKFLGTTINFMRDTKRYQLHFYVHLEQAYNADNTLKHCELLLTAIFWFLCDALVFT